MTIHPVAKVLSWWLFWHPAPPAEPEGLPPVRILVVQDPDPRRGDRLHLGVRFHSDGLGDAAITLQLSESVLPW